VGSSVVWLFPAQVRLMSDLLFRDQELEPKLKCFTPFPTVIIQLVLSYCDEELLPLLVGLNRQKIDLNLFFQRIKQLSDSKLPTHTAILWLAYCYIEGWGTEIDVIRARELLNSQEEKSWMGLYLTVVLDEDWEMETLSDSQKEKLIRDCETRHEQGDIHATYLLATFLNELSVRAPKDIFELYDNAAQKGHSMAQTMAADCFLYGIGVTQNKEKARELRTLAANQGCRVGQYELAQYYESEKVERFQDERDVIINEEEEAMARKYREKEAEKFYRLAADQGSKQAAKALQRRFEDNVSSSKKK